MKRSAPKVVVAIPTNGNDGREQMSGVFDYVNMHPGWKIHLINTRTDIANGALEIEAKDADGLLLSISCDNERIAERVLAKDVKVVVTNDHLAPLYEGRPNCRVLLLDNESIGRDAVRHVNSLGHFASYGFVHGHIHFPWSDGRERGFRTGVPRKVELFVYPLHKDSRLEVLTKGIDEKDLADWLSSLPKPAAVFGANDLFASDVMTACERLGLKVPQQVSVIGCDNDPLVWANTIPQLTSLQLPFRQLGFKAAETLDRLLHGRKTPDRTIYISGTRLFARGSSAPVPPATTLVEKARTYIRDHACDGIRAADVVAHIGVSRSLLDLRFRQVCGKSILEDILDTRLGEVRRQILETDRTFLQIGAACGFKAPDSLKRLFRSRFGMSMREFRAKGGTPPSA
ncbi:MAG: substrate-binding domain-containing protein [Kiritimatiellae bacterium]|nr:substrate-binding domain-containing protein [Kiritimatiellia bacterium]